MLTIFPHLNIKEKIDLVTYEIEAMGAIGPGHTRVYELYDTQVLV